MDGKHFLKTCFFFILVINIRCLSACSQKSGVYRYGSNCAFLCNCNNTAEQCNVVTGECLTSGCADGWIGRGCQFADIQFDLHDSRHDDNVNPPMFAKDALKPNLCSMTSDTPLDSGRYWRVWLPEGTQQIVRGANIRTMKNKTGFFDGFKFFVDVVRGNLGIKPYNRLNVVKEQLCHAQPAISPVTSPVIEVLCDTRPLTGNQMRFVLSTNGAQLVLCDVHVYGECQENVCGKLCEIACYCQEPVSADIKISGVCSNGCAGRWTSANGTTGLCNLECTSSQWGPSCSKTCGSCRVGEACDVISGKCPNYCEPGYTSSFCNKSCANGTYGYNCAEDCGHCQASAACNKRDGVCPNNLCEPGWRGSKCNERCSTGTFGEDCSSICSGHCKGDGLKCNHINGSCPDGCKAGWEGSMCHQACSDGKYGNGCAYDCGYCLNGSVCDKTSGSCRDSRCEPGWEGYTCKSICPIGNYGLGCSGKCSGHCKDHGNHCNHTNGGCQEGCKAGWKGFLCDEACEPGKWGSECLRQCGYCFNDTCDAVTGYCDAGCSSGYQNTNHCVAECAEYLYGLNCQYECSSGCEVGVPCDKATGHCLSRCTPGFKGNFCDQACKPGFYGKGCQFNCSGHCVNDEPCERVSGNCTNGCQSQYTGARCDIEKMLERHQEPPSPTGPIAGGVVAAMIVIALVIIGIFLLRRRNQLKSSQANRKQNEVPEFNNTSLADPHEGRFSYDDQNRRNNQYANMGWGADADATGSPVIGASSMIVNKQRVHEPTEYMNTTEDALEKPLLPQTTIYLSDLGNYIKNKSMEDFEEEFEKLQAGAQFSTNEALKPENKKKNRYRTLYPYDETRVKLKTKKGIPGSDYINASFIDGYDQKQIYIAAQGPTEKTIDDFWRMVSELKIQKIVMVTNCVEEGKEKCIKYWPDEQKLFGSVSVSTVSEEIFADFTVRTLGLREGKESSQRTITQYHFTSWPDHGTPDNISALVHFWQKVRNGEETRKQTWLIHCSAGVGRTGTLIGLDYLYDEGKANKHIDIYKCVETMRKQRINMVQRKEQYKFLHEVVFEALCSTTDPIPSDDFQTEYHHLKKIDPAANETNLLLEYEKMCSWTFHKYSETSNDNGDSNEDYKDEFSIAKAEENVEKNRDQNIIPADNFMPFLTTNVAGCTNYINAVYMPMYSSSRGFIVTQNPLSSTIVDYYRLLYEKTPAVIVSFNDEFETEATVPPQGSTLTIGPFSIELTEETEMSSYKVRTIQFTYMKETPATRMREYIFTKWAKNKKYPSDNVKYLHFLAEIQRIHLKDNLRPIVVRCLNGATKSGLFCVLWNVLERLRIDEEVAIPQTIRNLRHRRQQIIPDFEQFSFCYDAILTHIQSCDVYANV